MDSFLPPVGVNLRVDPLLVDLDLSNGNVASHRSGRTRRSAPTEHWQRPKPAGNSAIPVPLRGFSQLRPLQTNESEQMEYPYAYCPFRLADWRQVPQDLRPVRPDRSRSGGSQSNAECFRLVFLPKVETRRGQTRESATQLPLRPPPIRLGRSGSSPRSEPVRVGTRPTPTNAVRLFAWNARVPPQGRNTSRVGTRPTPTIFFPPFRLSASPTCRLAVSPL